MKKKYISLMLSALLLGGLTTSCNDWLDVEQNTEKKAEEMFDTEDGFRGALAGCYSAMCSTDMYGTRLTMSNVDALAALWYMNTDAKPNYSAGILDNYYFRKHDYSNSSAETSIRTIYSKLYNAILSTNMIINAFNEGKGANIIDEQERAIIEGEAYGLRAFLHLDVLRLFGQVPGGTTTVNLAYSEVTSIEDPLPFYSFDEYVTKLKADFAKSESLLKDNDVVFQYDYSFDQYSHMGEDKPEYKDVTVGNDFLAYRQYRMNYWAVRAAKARMHLYLGETEEAYKVAMDVINNAVTPSGKKLAPLSSDKDYGQSGIRNYASPTEALFSLYFDNLHDISVPLLVGSPTHDGSNEDERLQVTTQDNLYLTESLLTSLFSGCDGQDIRSRFMWGITTTSQGTPYPTISKYWVDEAGIIPLIRMSEMYLIAIETAGTLEESNTLYTEYIASKGVARHDYFTSIQQLTTEMANEYRREFYAEGQMFYYYKRTKATTMWSNGGQILSENNYILPLPNTEPK